MCLKIFNYEISFNRTVIIQRSGVEINMIDKILIEIRNVQLADYNKLTHLYDDIIIEGGHTADTEKQSKKSRTAFYIQHENPNWPLIVAEKDNELIGFAWLSPWRQGRKAVQKTAEVSFYISKEGRGQGLGTQFLDELIQRAEQLGYQHLIAILLDCNIASEALLKKFSFETWGHLPDIAELSSGRCGQYIYGRKIG